MATDPDRALSTGSPELAVLMLSLGRVVLGRLVAGPMGLAPVRRRTARSAEAPAR